MSRHRLFPTLLVIPLLVVSASCGQDRPTPVTRHQGPSTRPGVTEIDLKTAEAMKAAVSQRIYVPAYSHILISDNAQPYNLAVTLSVRNTDDARPIVVRRVRYHDQDGKLIHDYLKNPLKIDPLAAIEFFVKESDTSGGTSASFLVEWSAEERVSDPVVEAVMVGIAGSRGVSFLSPGRILPSGEARQ
jgi:hypothetical protein